MSLTALQQAVGEIEDEILSHNESLTDQTLSEEARDEADKQIEALMPRLELAKKRAEREAKLLQNLNGDTGKTRELQGITDEEEAKPKPIIHATCRRHRVKNFLNEKIDGRTPEERAYLFGETLMAAGAATNQKLRNWAPIAQRHEERFGKIAARPEIFGASTEGGNAGVFVPEQQTLDLVITMERYGLARQMAEVVTMTSEVRKDIKEGTDPTPTFEPELVDGEDVTTADDALITLTAQKLVAFLVQSQEVNEDAITEFGDSMLRRMANGFAAKEDQCMFNGTGTKAFGGMTGVRTKLQDIDGSGTDSFGLADASGTTWSAVTLADFNKPIALLPDFADTGPEEMPNAQWVMHRTFWWEVVVPLIEAGGGTTMGMLQAGPMGRMLKGFPVRLSNVFPKATAVGSVVATFGDHRRAVKFGDRRAFSVDFSTEATIGSVKLFQASGLGIRGSERFDINVHSVGDRAATKAEFVTGLQTAAS